MINKRVQKLGNASPDQSGLSVVSCDNILNHLGEMPDSCIIFCSIQDLLEFYLLGNYQRALPEIEQAETWQKVA